MNMFYKAFGGRIKRLRETAGLSQKDLSGSLGINRVSLSQIESGERKISAEELIKLSNIFNVSTDVLLNLDRDIKVVLTDRKERPPRKEEIRINVPQKNLDKFKEVLLYILNKVGSKPNVGETVIYKLLYFIDFNFYEKYEDQLIGATYQKNHHGPTPIEFTKIVDEMMDGNDLTKVTGKYFKYPQTKYLPLRPPELSKLKAHEIKLIDETLDHLSDMNAAQISEYSHNDVPWLTTEDQGIIEYESVFYRTPAYSVRNYGEDI